MPDTKPMRRAISANIPDTASAGAVVHARPKDLAATTPMRFLVEVDLSENQKLTPEGYLLCVDVALARVGDLVYMSSEVPEVPTTTGKVILSRTAEELFSPAAIASFNGKPVTLQHPDQFVTPETWAALSVGVILNVRADLESGLLVADLMITNPDAIEAIRSRAMRQISLGYDADVYIIDDGIGAQVNILGNHAALVQFGRCGPTCAITDSENPFMLILTKLLAAAGIKTEASPAVFADTSVEDLDRMTAELETIKAQKLADATPVEDAPVYPMAAVADQLMKMIERIDQISTRMDRMESEEWMKEWSERQKKEIQAALGVSEEQADAAEQMADGCVKVTDEAPKHSAEDIALAEILVPGAAFVSKVETLKAAFADAAVKQHIDATLNGEAFEASLEIPALVNVVFANAAAKVAAERTAKQARTSIADAAVQPAGSTDLAAIMSRAYAGQ